MKNTILFLCLILPIFTWAKPKPKAKSSFKIIYIGSKKIDCKESPSGSCFQYTPNKKYPYRTLVTPSFQFDFKEGYEYKIQVRVLKSASEKSQYQEDYQFVKILSKTKIISQNDKPDFQMSISNQWVLESFSKEITYNRPIEKTSYFTILPNRKEVNGNTGCNSFGGQVIIKGEKISFKDLFQTEKYCNESADQESTFMSLLLKVNRFQIVGAELNLFENNKLLMTMESYR